MSCPGVDSRAQPRGFQSPRRHDSDSNFQKKKALNSSYALKVSPSRRRLPLQKEIALTKLQCPTLHNNQVSEGLCSRGSSTCTIGCACSLPDAAFPEPGFKLHSSFKHRSSLNQANSKENQHSVFTTSFKLNYKNKLKIKINANTSLTSGQ